MSEGLLNRMFHVSHQVPNCFMVMRAAAVARIKKKPANVHRSKWQWRQQQRRRQQQQQLAYFSSSVCRGDLNTSEWLRSARKEMPVPRLDKALPLVGKLIKSAL